MLPAPCARFVAASDAAEDTPGQGIGGFLLVWKDSIEVREAFEEVITPELYRLFTPGTHKIARLELSTVLFALIDRPDRFRGRRGVFYIDNLAALMALIRGRSDAPDLKHLSRVIHAALFSLHTWIYWEWVPSKSNWADAISRLGQDDPWYVETVSTTSRHSSLYFCGTFRCQQSFGPSSMFECFGEECIGVSPHLVTWGGDRVVTRSAGPTFQEGPEAREVDLAHDAKAYPAEQVTRDAPVKAKRRGLCLVCRLALSSCERTPVCIHV